MVIRGVIQKSTSVHKGEGGQKRPKIGPHGLRMPPCYFQSCNTDCFYPFSIPHNLILIAICSGHLVLQVQVCTKTQKYLQNGEEISKCNGPLSKTPKNLLRVLCSYCLKPYLSMYRPTTFSWNVYLDIFGSLLDRVHTQSSISFSFQLFKQKVLILWTWN